MNDERNIDVVERVLRWLWLDLCDLANWKAHHLHLVPHLQPGRVVHEGEVRQLALVPSFIAGHLPDVEKKSDQHEQRCERDENADPPFQPAKARAELRGKILKGHGSRSSLPGAQEI